MKNPQNIIGKVIIETAPSAKQNVPAQLNAVVDNTNSDKSNDESLYKRIEKHLIDQNCPALEALIKNNPNIDLTRTYPKLYLELPVNSYLGDSITLIPVVSYFMRMTTKGYSGIVMKATSLHIPSASIEWANLLLYMVNEQIITIEMLNESLLFCGHTLLAMAVNSNQRELARALIEAGSTHTHFGLRHHIHGTMVLYGGYSATLRMLGYDDKEMITPSLMRLLANFFLEYARSMELKLQRDPLEKALLNADSTSELSIAENMRDFLTLILKSDKIRIRSAIKDFLAKLNDMLIPLALKYERYDVLFKLLNDENYPFDPAKLYGEHTLMDVAILNEKDDIVCHLLNRVVPSKVQSKYIENSKVGQYWLDKITPDCDLWILQLWAMATVDKLSPMWFNNKLFITSDRKGALDALKKLIDQKEEFLDRSEASDNSGISVRRKLINHIFAAVENVTFPDLPEAELWYKLRNKLDSEFDLNQGRLYSKIAKLLKSRDCEALTQLIDLSPVIDFNHPYHFSEVNIPDNIGFSAPLTFIKVLVYFMDADLIEHRHVSHSIAMQPTAEQNEWAVLLSNLINRKRISPELLNANVIPNFSLLYCAILSNHPALSRAIIEAVSVSCSCGDEICTLHVWMYSLMVTKSGYANLLSKIGFDKDAKLAKPLILFFIKFLMSIKSDIKINISEDTDELSILQHMLKTMTPGKEINMPINECGCSELRDALCDALIDHAIVDEKPEVLLDVLNDVRYKFDSGKLYHYEKLTIFNFLPLKFLCTIPANSIPLISIAIKYCAMYQRELASEFFETEIPYSDQFKIKHDLWNEIVVKLLAKNDLTHAILSKQSLGNGKFTVLDTAVVLRQMNVIFDLLNRHPIPKFTYNILDVKKNNKFWLDEITPDCNILVLKLWALMTKKRLSEMSYNTTLMIFSKRKGALEALTELLESKNEVTYDQWADHIYNALARVATFDPEKDAVWIKLRNKVFELRPKGVQMNKFDVSKDDDAHFNQSDSLADSARDGMEMKIVNDDHNDDNDFTDSKDGTEMKEIQVYAVSKSENSRNQNRKF